MHVFLVQFFYETYCEKVKQHVKKFDREFKQPLRKEKESLETVNLHEHVLLRSV